VRSPRPTDKQTAEQTNPMALAILAIRGEHHPRHGNGGKLRGIAADVNGVLCRNAGAHNVGRRSPL